MLRSFVRTPPTFQISPTTCLAPENFHDHVYVVNQNVLEGFTAVDQTTRKYTFQAFTSFHLPHYKCQERRATAWNETSPSLDPFRTRKDRNQPLPFSSFAIF